MVEKYLTGWLYAAFILLTVPFISGNLACSSPYKSAILQGLDKVTARVSTISLPIGNTIRFGTLDIIVRYCDKRPPEETPESAAFLDIRQSRRGEPSMPLFRGWMFASSPALSALEHPVYDIWVLDCVGKLEGGYSN